MQASPHLRWRFRLVLGSTLALLGCSLEDRVLGNDLAGFERGPSIDFDYGPLAPNGCDLTGTWIAEQETQNSVLVTGLAVAHNWAYYEIVDEGDKFTVTRGWDCGFEIDGITSVSMFPDTTAALALRNRQEGVLDATLSPPPTVAPRTGFYRPGRDPETCEFYLERWWFLRGLAPRFLPERSMYGELDIADMEARAPLPTKDALLGNEDWDNDDKPGITLEVWKPLRGQRHVAQRDWNEFGPFFVPDGAGKFFGPIAFNNQETVLETSSPLLAAGSTPLDEGHTIRFIRIDEKAPTDIEAFIPWCQKNIAEVFTAIRKAERGDD